MDKRLEALFQAAHSQTLFDRVVYREVDMLFGLRLRNYKLYSLINDIFLLQAPPWDLFTHLRIIMKVCMRKLLVCWIFTNYLLGKFHRYQTRL